MLAAIDPKRWSIVLPDMRGYGGSAAISGPFNMATVASDVLEIADYLGWERFSLIGHSMGGKVSLRTAVDAPTRIDRIVAVSPTWAGAVPFKAEQLAYFRSSVERIEARAAIIAQTTGNRLPQFWRQQGRELRRQIAVQKPTQAIWNPWSSTISKQTQEDSINKSLSL